MIVTPLYAGLLTLWFVVLSVRVVNLRRAGIIFGDNGDHGVIRIVRAQANFAEYVPFTLLLMGLAESMAPPRIIMHLVGITLVAGRLLHAYGLSQTPHILRYRVWGTTLTFLALGVAALMCFSLSALFLAI